MHRIDTDGNVSNLFDPGDPAVPRNPTQIDAPWLNDVQEELCNTITSAGITLVKGNQEQLLAAILTFVNAVPTLYHVGHEPAVNYDNSYSDDHTSGTWYYQQADGTVVIRISARNSGVTGTDSGSIFTLPAGMRPNNEVRHSFQIGGTSMVLQILPTGQVHILSGGSYTFVNLDVGFVFHPSAS